MKYLVILVVVVVGLLAWIGVNVQQSENRARDAQHEKEVEAQQYLDCTAHAKYPDLCIAPE